MDNVDINKKVEYIYSINIEVINNIVIIMVENIIKSFNFLLLDDQSKCKLKGLLHQECVEKVRREIEYKITIEDLYSESEKKEALNKLPQFTKDLI